MSVYKGTTLLAGVATNTKYNANNLLDFKWSDYQLSDQSWLRADTFSWQDGTVYSDAYNHLVADYNGGTSQTETIGSYTITYVLATDGHKITTDETTVANIYNESGVAWYYILDTANQRFKLPRTKYGFVGLRDTVGKYVPESLPSFEIVSKTSQPLQGGTAPAGTKLTGVSGNYGIRTESTAYGDSNPAGMVLQSSSLTAGTTFYPDNSTYQDSAPVQQRATQMYLYFYVGQFSQSATEQTAGLNASLFNGKADRDLNNLTLQAGAGLNSVGVRTVVETYQNGSNWYRIWSDGWIEQGGYVTSSGSSGKTINMLKSFNDTNYTIVGSCGGNDTDTVGYSPTFLNKTNSTFLWRTFNSGQGYDKNGSWYACGY